MARALALLECGLQYENTATGHLKQTYDSIVIKGKTLESWLLIFNISVVKIRQTDRQELQRMARVFITRGVQLKGDWSGARRCGPAQTLRGTDLWGVGLSGLPAPFSLFGNQRFAGMIYIVTP